MIVGRNAEQESKRRTLQLQQEKNPERYTQAPLTRLSVVDPSVSDPAVIGPIESRPVTIGSATISSVTVDLRTISVFPAASLLVSLLIFASSTTLSASPPSPSASKGRNTAKAKPNKPTSKWDAFAQQNRLKPGPGPEETPQDYAFGIESRIANQEARQLIRRPEGFNQQAYEGFKLFFQVFGEEGQSVGNCVSCHTPPNFTDQELHAIGGAAPMKTPTLRNLSERAPFGSSNQHATLEAAIFEKLTLGNQARSNPSLRPAQPRPTSNLHTTTLQTTPDSQSDPMRHVALTEDDIAKLAAFLRQLDDVGEDQFRYFLIHFDN